MRENRVLHRYLTAEIIKTGQTTKYQDGDDGDLQLGVEHDYETLTTGQFSGTTNITINGKTHAQSNNCVRDWRARINGKPLMWQRNVCTADIGPATDGKLFWEQYTVTDTCTFNAAAKTIAADAGNPFDTGAICVGRKIVTDSENNPGPFTVAASADNLITVNEAVVNEASVSITISTVDDLAKDFVDQANANSLSGYTDWCLPTKRELESLTNNENCNPAIDTDAFPSTPATYHWTSSTNPCNSASAWIVYFSNGFVYDSTKRTHKYYVRLVRG